MTDETEPFFTTKLALFRRDIAAVLRRVWPQRVDPPRCKSCNNPLTTFGPIWTGSVWSCYTAGCPERDQPQDVPA